MYMDDKPRSAQSLSRLQDYARDFPAKESTSEKVSSVSSITYESATGRDFRFTDSQLKDAVQHAHKASMPLVIVLSDQNTTNLNGAKKGMVQVTRECYAAPDREAAFLHIDADNAKANPNSDYAQLAARLLPHNPSAVVVTTQLDGNQVPYLDVDNAFVIGSNNLLPSALQFAIDEQNVRIRQRRTGSESAVVASNAKFEYHHEERRSLTDIDQKLRKLLERVDALIDKYAASPPSEPQA